VDTAEKLSRVPGIRPLDGLDHAYVWSMGPFHFAAALATDGRHLLQTSQREVLDEELVRHALRFARAHEKEVLAAAPFAVIEGFSAPGWQFDVLVAGMPAVHRMHEVKDPELHALTYAVYPVYRCEFSGLETEDEAAYRIQRGVPAGDYRREGPSPYVRMRWENARTRSGSGDTAGLTDLDYLLDRLRNLVDAGPGSFVEFENYRGEKRRVEWRDGALVLLGDGGERQVQVPELITWVREFICPTRAG
jgi:hypothetical protein